MFDQSRLEAEWLVDSSSLWLSIYHALLGIAIRHTFTLFAMRICANVVHTAFAVDILSFARSRRYCKHDSQFFAERVVKVWNSLPITTNFATLPVFRQSIMCVDFSAFLKVFYFPVCILLLSFVLLRHWYASYHCILEIVF